jgi:cysteine desulfurase
MGSEIKRDAEDLIKLHGIPPREVYLDSENSGLIFPEALKAMVDCYVSYGYGHPSITHKVGWESYEVLVKSSEVISRALGCNSDEIVYLHSGTEANNLAVLGFAKAHGDSSRRKILVSSIEHLSVIHVAESLAKYGFEVVKIPVDGEGFVDLDALSSLIDSNTLMVSVGMVNHEIGVIQDLRGIIEVVKDRDENIVLHTDAVDALGRVKFNLKDLGVDLASFSSHKVFGPKGAACLYVRDGLNLEPILYGQLSTQRLWPGLENVPAICGFAKAVEVMMNNFSEFNSKMVGFRDMLIDGILNSVDHSILNGPRGGRRVSDNVNISFIYCEGEALTVELSLRGIYVSSGSACTSRILQPSHVLIAIGRRFEEAHGSILMKVTPMHSSDDIKYVLENIPKAVGRVRSISPFKSG